MDKDKVMLCNSYKKRISLCLLCTFLVLLVQGCAVWYKPPPDIQDASKVSSLIDKGSQHLREGSLGSAQACFEVALQVFENPEALDGLGCVAFLKRDYNRAERYYRRAYELSPGYYNSLGNLALLYETMGDHEEAIRIYEYVISIEPTNMRFRNNFAALLFDIKKERGGDLGVVREELLRAEVLYPHPLVLDNLEKVRS